MANTAVSIYEYTKTEEGKQKFTPVELNLKANGELKLLSDKCRTGMCYLC